MRFKVLYIFSILYILCPIVASFDKTDVLDDSYSYVISEVRAEKGEKDKKADKTAKKEAVDKEKGAAASTTGSATEGDLYSYEEPTAEEVSYTGLIFRSILILGLFIGGFYWFFRFITKKTKLMGSAGDIIDVLSITPIGQNKFIQIVNIGSHLLVLGVSDNAINLIKEITDKDEVERIKILSAKRTSVENPGFQEFITSQIGHLADFVKSKKGGQKSKGENKKTFEDYGDFSHSSGMDYLQSQKERLKKMNDKK